MNQHNKDRIVGLLKGIETGDPESVRVVNEARYIQHNPQTREGSVGLAELFKQLAATNPRVNIVRVFEDGDFVFAHTEYDFASRNIGFEVFRFEAGQAVEHWDNIQRRIDPEDDGPSMVDGPVEPTDLSLTEFNRATVRRFVDDVLISGTEGKLEDFIETDHYTEHHPHTDGGHSVFAAQLGSKHLSHSRVYEKRHHLLAEGSFVLTACEGRLNGRHTAYYDLFRLQGGKIIEHWDTIETIPDRQEWRNDNGKF